MVFGGVDDSSNPVKEIMHDEHTADPLLEIARVTFKATSSD
jgi:hypothetical protein